MRIMYSLITIIASLYRCRDCTAVIGCRANSYDNRNRKQYTRDFYSAHKGEM